MEYLQNGITLHIPPGCFPLSTDSILLGEFVRPGKGARVLDLGAGCATLGLLLCAAYPNCHITGIELDPAAHEAGLENILRNGLTERLSSICTDMRTIPNGNFDLCISNPPYFSGGPASKTTPHARREDCCSIEELFQTAARNLRYGGDFCLIHKPERLSELCAQAAKSGLEPKRLRLIRHRTDGPVSLILLSCRKGAKPGLVWEERSLRHADGTPTEYYRTLYHL